MHQSFIVGKANKGILMSICSLQKLSQKKKKKFIVKGFYLWEGNNKLRYSK